MWRSSRDNAPFSPVLTPMRAAISERRRRAEGSKGPSVSRPNGWKLTRTFREAYLALLRSSAQAAAAPADSGGMKIAGRARMDYCRVPRHRDAPREWQHNDAVWSFVIDASEAPGSRIATTPASDRAFLSRLLTWRVVHAAPRRAGRKARVDHENRESRRTNTRRPLPLARQRISRSTRRQSRPTIESRGASSVARKRIAFSEEEAARIRAVSTGPGDEASKSANAASVSGSRHFHSRDASSKVGSRRPHHSPRAKRRVLLRTDRPP